MKLFVAASIALIAGAAPAATPQLDMVGFFTGRTHSENVLKIIFHRSSGMVVDSVGKMEGKQFVLVDTVRQQGQAPRTRKWVIHPVGPGHFSGTLSDATGPVDITMSGGSATIRYTMEGGLNLEQRLQVIDGHTLANHTAVRKFGMKFGSVEGKIHKLD